MVDQRFVDEKAEREAAERAQKAAEDWQPMFTPEQLATPPSNPELLPEPPVPPPTEETDLPRTTLMTTRDMSQGQVRTQDTDQRRAREIEDRERREREQRQERERELEQRQRQEAADRQHAAEREPKKPAR